MDRVKNKISISRIVKKVFIGAPLSSKSIGEATLKKRVALPVFAADALSSVAYAPNEVLLTLSIAGVAGLRFSLQIGVCIAVIMGVVIFCYRQNVNEYPSGGGDYEVVSKNLGHNCGILIGAALFVDYIMTVAVSISSGTQYIVSMISSLHGHETTMAVGIIILIAVINMRGIKESGSFFAIPVYLFIIAIALTIFMGLFEYFTGSLPQADSGSYIINNHDEFISNMASFGGFILLLRAFGSGTTALTGIEAISNGVPNFEKPKSKNASITLAILGSISCAMLLGILFLAEKTGVKYAADPLKQLLTADGSPLSGDYLQLPVIGQLANTIFHHNDTMFVVVSLVTGIILLLAANTAFNGFPVLGSILARDGYMPRYMRIRGDKLAYSNGILMLTTLAVIIVIIFDANPTKLIELYVVGVFLSFTLSQLGMIIHWTRKIRENTDNSNKRRILVLLKSRVISAVGFIMTGIVLVIILISKFIHGAWVTVVAIILLWFFMKAIDSYYKRSHEEVIYRAKNNNSINDASISNTHSIVLVSELTKPVVRALNYAKLSNPESIEALAVDSNDGQIDKLRSCWQKQNISVPLNIIESPFRDILTPIVDYIATLRDENKERIIVVYLPELVDGRTFERLLHNQTAGKIKRRLRLMKGVMVVSVPWQMKTAIDPSFANPFHLHFRHPSNH
ncbi:MAG: APC family permease [Candidatus Ancillula sp.]|nr:APC family permease [Candidatus Ancillula sp.]